MTALIAPYHLINVSSQKQTVKNINGATISVDVNQKVLINDDGWIVDLSLFKFHNNQGQTIPPYAYFLNPTQYMLMGGLGLCVKTNI